jgi:hypothetical protein
MAGEIELELVPQVSSPRLAKAKPSSSREGAVCLDERLNMLNDARDL